MLCYEHHHYCTGSALLYSSGKPLNSSDLENCWLVCSASLPHLTITPLHCVCLGLVPAPPEWLTSEVSKLERQGNIC